MLIHIIKKELLNNLLTARILICYVAIFVVIFTSVLIRGIHYKGEYEFYLDQARQEREWVQQQEEEGQSDEYLWMFSMQLPPRPLSIFCEGYNKHMAMPFRIVTNRGRYYQTFDYENSITRVFRIFNTAFVVAMVISLICIFISFDSFTAEREGGTLALVLSHSVSRSTYIMGKFLGSLLSVIWPVVFTLLFSLLFLMLGMQIRFAGEDLLRFILMLGVLVLYLAFWFLASMLFSVLVRRSSMALSLSVLSWIVLAFVIPYGAHEAGKRQVDTLSLSDLYKERARTESEEKVKRDEKWGKAKRENAPDFLRKEWKIYYDYYFALFRRMTTMEKELRRDIRRQMSRGLQWARISPVAQYLDVTSNLAGTGFYDYWQIVEWKEDLFMAYKDSYEEERNRRRAIEWAAEDAGDPNAGNIRFEPFDTGRLPSKIPPVITTAGAVGNSLTDILSLVLWSIVLFIGGFSAFIRREGT